MEQTEAKRGPGRPAHNTVGITALPEIKRNPAHEQHREVIFVKVHDAVALLNGDTMLTLSTSGPRALKSLVEADRGIFGVTTSGREFTVPYANIAFYEYKIGT